MMIQPEQSLPALPNFVPEDSFCRSGEEDDEKEEMEEWADIDQDLTLWHFDLEEVENWLIISTFVKNMSWFGKQKVRVKFFIKQTISY